MKQNNLLNSCQSGFRPNDFYVIYLILMTHNIYRAFNVDYPLEVRGVFLNLLEAFDEVSYELKNNGIDGNALQLFESFLHNKPQRVVLNAQSSSWQSVRAGLSQGSLLRTLFYLIDFNDLLQGLNSEIKLFADDTSLFDVVNCVNVSASTLNSDLLKIQDWA